jgi:hypothetical protein
MNRSKKIRDVIKKRRAVKYSKMPSSFVMLRNASFGK